MVGAAFRCLIYCLAFVLVANLVSCKVQRIAYFKDVPDSTTATKILQSIPSGPAVVHPDDVLNITIQTLDPQANVILNQGNLPINTGAVSGVTNNVQQAIVAGYLVDKDGFVHLPYVGDVLVKGLTSGQVKN